LIPTWIQATDSRAARTWRIAGQALRSLRLGSLQLRDRRAGMKLGAPGSQAEAAQQSIRPNSSRRPACGPSCFVSMWSRFHRPARPACVARTTCLSWPSPSARAPSTWSAVTRAGWPWPTSTPSWRMRNSWIDPCHEWTRLRSPEPRGRCKTAPCQPCPLSRTERLGPAARSAGADALAVPAAPPRRLMRRGHPCVGWAHAAPGDHYGDEAGARQGPAARVRGLRTPAVRCTSSAGGFLPIPVGRSGCFQVSRQRMLRPGSPSP
jgi:hypothetical protein